jgi:hypothetical protein
MLVSNWRKIRQGEDDDRGISQHQTDGTGRRKYLAPLNIRVRGRRCGIYAASEDLLT